jgi:aryl-alcohol dehydrogenase-like predicted oxidoreductase
VDQVTAREHDIDTAQMVDGQAVLAGEPADAAGGGQADMRRVRDPRWQGENFAKNRAALSQLETLAADKGIALSQLALAWLLAQGDDIVPIPGTRNAERLEENVGAADVTLSAEDLGRIRDAFPDGAYGTRYAEASLPAWV